MLVEKQTELAWKQRLGYLLEKIGATELAEVLKVHLKKQNSIDYIPLLSGLKNPSAMKKNTIWKILENTTIESDDL